MFAGFNLAMQEECLVDGYYGKGADYLRSQKSKIEDNLMSFICESESIDGTSLQENWFPALKMDAFLSHSHKDEKLTVALAGWLHDECGVDSFVDSFIWGYADDLLEIMDNCYCVKSKTETNTTYDYQLRNRTTSHVHMMLNVAIQNMIDRSECLLFVNTPNSMMVKNSMQGGGTTLSPWIYSEIAFSQIVRHRKLSEYRCGGTENVTRKDALFEHAELKVGYSVSTEHLEKLSFTDLEKWKQDIDKCKKTITYPLDLLYRRMSLI